MATEPLVVTVRQTGAEPVRKTLESLGISAARVEANVIRMNRSLSDTGKQAASVDRVSRSTKALNLSMGSVTGTAGRLRGSLAGLANGLGLTQAIRNMGSFEQRMAAVAAEAGNLARASDEFAAAQARSKTNVGQLSKELSLVDRLAADFGATIDGVSTALTLYQGVTVAAKFATLNLKRALIGTGIGALIVGFGALVNLLIDFGNTTEEVEGVTIRGWDKINAAIGAARDFITRQVDRIKSVIAAIVPGDLNFTGIVDKFGEAMRGILSFVKSTVDFQLGVWFSLRAGIIEILKSLPALVGNQFARSANRAIGALEFLGNAAVKTINAVRVRLGKEPLGEVALKRFEDNTEETMTRIGGAIRAGWEEGTTLTRRSWELIGGVVSDEMDQVRDDYQRRLDEITTSTETTTNDIGQAYEQLTPTVRNSLAELGGEGKRQVTLVNDEIERTGSVLEGAKGAAQDLGQAYQQLTPSVRDALAELGGEGKSQISMVNDEIKRTETVLEDAEGATQNLGQAYELLTPKVRRALAGIDEVEAKTTGFFSSLEGLSGRAAVVLTTGFDVLEVELTNFFNTGKFNAEEFFNSLTDLASDFLTRELTRLFRGASVAATAFFKNFKGLSDEAKTAIISGIKLTEAAFVEFARTGKLNAEELFDSLGDLATDFFAGEMIQLIEGSSVALQNYFKNLEGLNANAVTALTSGIKVVENSLTEFVRTGKLSTEDLFTSLRDVAAQFFAKELRSLLEQGTKSFISHFAATKAGAAEASAAQVAAQTVTTDFHIQANANMAASSNTFFSGLQSLAAATGDILVGVWNTVGGAVSSFFTASKAGAEETSVAQVAAQTVTTDFHIQANANMEASSSTFFGRLQGLAGTAGNFLIDVFKDIGGGLSTFLKTGAASFDGFFGGVVKGLQGLSGGKITSAIGGAISTVAGGIFGAVKTGLSRVAGFFGFADGGHVGDTVRGFADGGFIRGPGTTTSDSIPALLSDQEFIVNAAATKKFRPVLEAINDNRVPGFAPGGSVGSQFEGSREAAERAARPENREAAREVGRRVSEPGFIEEVDRRNRADARAEALFNLVRRGVTRGAFLANPIAGAIATVVFNLEGAIKGVGRFNERVAGALGLELTPLTPEDIAGSPDSGGGGGSGNEETFGGGLPVRVGRDLGPLVRGVFEGSAQALVDGIEGSISAFNSVGAGIDGRSPNLPQIRGFRNGGSMRPGETGVVGEAGPELVTAGGSGATVTPIAANDDLLEELINQQRMTRREIAQLRKVIAELLAEGNVDLVKLRRAAESPRSSGRLAGAAA